MLITAAPLGDWNLLAALPFDMRATFKTSDEAKSYLAVKHWTQVGTGQQDSEDYWVFRDQFNRFGFLFPLRNGKWRFAK